MTIEKTIEDIHSAGLLVLNLFEVPEGLWQANVYDGEKAWDFGRANTPEGALREALRNSEIGQGIKLIEGRKLLPGTGKAMSDEEAEKLLDALF